MENNSLIIKQIPEWGIHHQKDQDLPKSISFKKKSSILLKYDGIKVLRYEGMGHTSGDSVLARVAHITKPKPNTNGSARPIDNLLYQLPVHIYIKCSVRCQLARLLLFLFKNHFACLSTCFQGFEAMSGEVYSWNLKKKKKKPFYIPIRYSIHVLCNMTYSGNYYPNRS